MKNYLVNEAEKALFTSLDSLEHQKKLSSKNSSILRNFYFEYKKATSSHLKEEERLAIFSTFFSLMQEQIKSSTAFEPYHQKIREPFDYYQFGLDFTRPLINFQKSWVLGKENLVKANAFLEKQESVVFLANHQTELDPQIIDLLLQKEFPKIASDTIYVAGERVVTDPAAIPFSLGRDLLCIYSKKYIDCVPHLKEKKLYHNQLTMRLTSSLFTEGGKSIYVAPSGGRDRRDKKGEVFPDPFDPQSIEMFYLMSKKAKRRVHFFPLALYTHPVLPPPDTIQKEIGEIRHANFSFCRLCFAEEISMEAFTGVNKQQARKNRALFITDVVKQEYEKLL